MRISSRRMTSTILISIMERFTLRSGGCHGEQWRASGDAVVWDVRMDEKGGAGVDKQFRKTDRAARITARGKWRNQGSFLGSWAETLVGLGVTGDIGNEGEVSLPTLTLYRFTWPHVFS